jgi:hypothetical protein
VTVVQRPFAIALAVGCVIAALVPLRAAAPRAGDIVVSATYKGKGPVDDKHHILLFLFSEPNPTADSKPIAMQSVAKNGATATFKNVTQDSVYVIGVYDEKSNYDGNSGPPPAGTPFATYGKRGKPVAVKPGSPPKIAFVFDDTKRFK